MKHTTVCIASLKRVLMLCICKYLLAKILHSAIIIYSNWYLNAGKDFWTGFISENINKPNDHILSLTYTLIKVKSLRLHFFVVYYGIPELIHISCLCQIPYELFCPSVLRNNVCIRSTISVLFITNWIIIFSYIPCMNTLIRIIGTHSVGDYLTYALYKM